MKSTSTLRTAYIFLCSICIATFTIINLHAQNCTVNAGIPQIICQADGSFTLTGIASEPLSNQPDRQWVQLEGPNTATIQSPTQEVTNVTNIITGQYVFEFSAVCQNGIRTHDSVIVTVDDPPPALNLSDITMCFETTITLPTVSNVSYRTYQDNSAGIYTYVTSSTSTTPRFESYYASTGVDKIYVESSRGTCTRLDSFNLTHQGSPNTVCAGPDFFYL